MQDDHQGARDRAWVEAVRAGDRAAFAELYRVHAPSVRTIATDYVHDRDAADDIVQETFTRALDHLDDLHAPEAFRGWLYAIARNCATDVVRRRLVEGPGDTEPVLDAVAAAELGPEELAELGELVRLVDGSVVGLTVRDATAVVMMTGLGFGSADVAAVLGTTPGAAKVLAHRARDRLRQSLNLQLLVRLRGRHCATFAALVDRHEPLAAARHTTACDSCRRAAAAEIVLYALEADDADTLGPQGVDEGAGDGVGPPLDEPEP